MRYKRLRRASRWAAWAMSFFCVMGALFTVILICWTSCAIFGVL